VGDTKAVKRQNKKEKLKMTNNGLQDITPKM
jgi:hypothetical protein